jgi:hypothetical protein
MIQVKRIKTSESTTSGAVASVSLPLGKTIKRSSIGRGIYGNEKGGNLLTGKKTNKKFANSVKKELDEGFNDIVSSLMNRVKTIPLTKDIGKYVLIAEKGDGAGDFYVKAYIKGDTNNPVGGVVFTTSDGGKTYYSDDTYVYDPHKRKGIATAMYNFAREHGINIVPSSEQTPVGKDFTNAYFNSVKESNINEIGYASALGELQLSKEEIIKSSTQVGTIGSRKVFLYQVGKDQIYFFTGNSNIEALVYLYGNRLTAIKNYTSNKGLIFNLFQYIINIEKQKIEIHPIDKLTKDGITWIIKQIDRIGFTITDVNGDQLTSKELYNEWKTAQETGKTGSTGIIISESKNSDHIRENESRLMPMDIFGATLKKIDRITEDLFNIDNLIKESNINEIGYAGRLVDNTYSTSSLLKMGKVVGSIENNDVLHIADGDEKVYFLVVDGKVTSFVGFKNNYLKNIKNFTETAGVVRALVGFLVHIKGEKLKISADELLTPDGIKWVIHLIKSPRGLNIRDQAGNPVDPIQLKKEWVKARDSGEPGPTGIIISEHIKFGKKLRENETRRNEKSLLMAFNLYNINKPVSEITNMKKVTETTGVTDYNPKSQGGSRKELLAKYAKTKDPKDAAAARKAGAAEAELAAAKDLKKGVAEGKIQIGVLDNDNVNLIIDKSESKPDGIYSFRGILFKVKGGKVTHYATNGKILQAMGRVNTRIGSYDSSSRAKSILKGIEEGVAETSDYFRRRQREEDIISGKKPARKKQPAQTSDYSKRREQEKKKEQGVAEGSSQGYFYLQGGIDRSKKFATKQEAVAHKDVFFQFARVPRITLRYKEAGKPSVVVGEYNLNEQGVAEGSSNQKTFTVVYYSPKTDRNVTKTIKADSESEVWDKLELKGLDVVSVKEQGVTEGSKTVKDRKTGKEYDPAAEFEKLLKDPETVDQLKRMGKEQGKGWPQRKDPKGVSEAKLDEEDIIIVPGMRKNKDKSFISRKEDRRDHEVDMARSDLRATAKNAKRIFDALKTRTEDEGIMGWQQAYITLAADYLNSVADSIEHEQLKLMDQDPSMKMENNIKSGRSAQERFNASYKKATGTDLNDQEKFWKEKQKEIAKRKQEYIDQGIISPDEEVKEELRPKHIMGGLALVAALMGADHLSSAKQTPLGKAMTVAAQQGDQEAAKYLANLDELVDTKQSALLTKLSNKYLRDMEESATIVTPRDVPTLNKESSIMKGIQNEAKKMKGEDPCWDGYEMIGKKKKDGKEVPNCVPKKKK